MQSSRAIPRPFHAFAVVLASLLLAAFLFCLAPSEAHADPQGEYECAMVTTEATGDVPANSLIFFCDDADPGDGGAERTVELSLHGGAGSASYTGTVYSSFEAGPLCKSVVAVFSEEGATVRCYDMDFGGPYASGNENTILVSADLSAVDFDNYSSMANMFSGARNLKSVTFGEDFDPDYLEDMSGMFLNCLSLESVTFPDGFDPDELRDTSNMFRGCVSLESFTFPEGFDPYELRDMSGMFACQWDGSKLESVTFPEGFDPYHLEDMTGMFNGCTSLKSVTFPEGFDPNYLEYMGGMFSGCESLEDITFPEDFSPEYLREMSGMFSDCASLENVTFPEGFDPNRLQDMSSMFRGCTGLKSVSFPDEFSPSAISDMSYMFKRCTSLEKILMPGLDTTGNGWTGKMMFDGAKNLRILSVGPYFAADAESAEGWGLSAPPSSGGYTGKWVRISSLDDDPWVYQGTALSNKDFLKGFNDGVPTGMEGIWVWQEARPKVAYRSGVEGSTSWQGWKRDGALSGTVGKSLRMEGLKIELEDAPYPGGIEYKSQLQSDGWEKNWKRDGETSGYNPQKTGGKRLEAVQIQLYGEMAEHYDVWYHLQVQRFGWMAWAKNGEPSGTVGYAFRVEAVEIVLAPKGGEAPTVGSKVASDQANMLSFVRCRSYDDKVWQGAKGEGDVSGTRGQAKTCVRVGLAASSFNAAGVDKGDSYIQVRVYQNGEWSEWSAEDDQEVGSKSGKPITGFQARIAPGTTLASKYDLYYRAEVRESTKACWLGWAKNGRIAGQSNLNLEQLEFSLVEKGDPAPPANADELKDTVAHIKQTWVIERWPCNWPKASYRFVSTVAKTQVSLGGNHSAAVTEDGDLYMWGRNNYGQLGKGDHYYDSNMPGMVLSNVSQVSLGGNHSAAVTEDGDLYMWGYNYYGQVGDGGHYIYDDRTEPVKVLSNVSQVSLGDYHSAAVTGDGDLYMWGRNNYGQLGDGTTTDRHTPFKVLSGVKQVSLGDDHSAAVTEDGDLYVWGYNGRGQLGTGDTDDRLSPVKILSDVSQVSLGGFHSAAVTEDGDLYMWGYNYYGQVGDGTQTDRLTPVKVLSGVRQVSLGHAHSAAITEDGDLYLWGDNGYVQLGIGTDRYEMRTSPEKVLSGVKQVSLGRSHSAAITEYGELYVWGCNDYGQVGDGTTTIRSSPVLIGSF